MPNKYKRFLKRISRPIQGLEEDDPWQQDVVSGVMARVVLDTTDRLWAGFAISMGIVFFFTSETQGGVTLRINAALPGPKIVTDMVLLVFGVIYLIGSLWGKRKLIMLGSFLCSMWSYVFAGISLFGTVFNEPGFGLFTIAVWFVFGTIYLIHGMIRTKKFMEGW